MIRCPNCFNEIKHVKIDSEGPLCAEALEFLRKSLG
jgi:hypothetical protein